MKGLKFSIISLVFLTAPASFTLHAANSAVVNVKGTLTPAACNISVTGAANFGTISVSALKENGLKHKGYQLGIKTVPFNIACDSPVKTAFTVTADHLGAGSTSPIGVSMPDGTETGKQDESYIPLIDGNGELMGYHNVFLSSFEADNNKSIDRIFSDDGGMTWKKMAYQGDNASYIKADGVSRYSWANTGELTSLATENLQGLFQVSAAIIPDYVETITDDVSFDTNTTLAIVYL
ncbi:hypothetical protein C3432_11940 [Citrobacter amalonaticus]|uniref:DUF1120 domain-containing protein n=1 Tax=Citrobacter amalonaticus TaxID=35703 RepID=A0A2S4RRG5_CITAM|nr:DUF1120 domain-containing protein [Citrobacter amalonaticus]POT58587.1 hypothetical protein C3432_11940 [Citrobacter amalonaticus]POT70325.1 hypothetical protein C3436_24640 [Citrobacter amalonaticus]POU61309.1 hypothetical protein C3430_23550 [Citrobacter amalonaticus]POV05122.1 hypothetical protein C3424_07180 [Citrobacter amalonaticus]